MLKSISPDSRNDAFIFIPNEVLRVNNDTKKIDGQILHTLRNNVEHNHPIDIFEVPLKSSDMNIYKLSRRAAPRYRTTVSFDMLRNAKKCIIIPLIDSFEELTDFDNDTHNSWMCIPLLHHHY